MKDYLLRGIPEDLWREVKATAALNGVTVREVIIELLEIYIQKVNDTDLPPSLRKQIV